MARRNSLACILLLLWPFYNVMASSAAVLELKTGQKVEGDYAGGSATEIKLKVGSQILVFPVQDVSRLHFIAPASEGDFSGDSLKALRILKSLQSVTKAGVNLGEYSRRVNDAAIEIDAFLDKYKGAEQQGVLTEVREVMKLYSLASRAWSGAIARSWVSVTDEDLQRCHALREEFAIMYPHPGGPGYLLTESARKLWSCADERLTKVEDLIKPK
jgi:hypothetical protein